MKVAYVMSRFPKHTETFILHEIIAVEEQGVPVDIYPLLKQRDAIVHKEALPLVERAHYLPFVSPSIIASNLIIIKRNALSYFRTFLEVLRGTFRNINFLFGAISLFPKAVHLSRKMVDEQVTHIHAHFSNHPAVVALIIHRLTGIPFSFTAHGHDIHVDRTMLKEKITAASFVVTISEYNKSLMEKECAPGDENKIHVIHCGVDLRVFRSQLKGNSRKQVRIICVASLLEVKGHTYLIHACKQLLDRGLKFTCHLVGEGNYRKRIENEIKQLGLEDCVILHGACTQSHVYDLLVSSDIFVLASVFTSRGAREGIPVSMMEAMAVGIPIVASNISGIPELVENGVSGFLISPGNINELAERISCLINDDLLREEMGVAARKVVLDNFNLESSATQLISSFRKASKDGS